MEEDGSESLNEIKTFLDYGRTEEGYLEEIHKRRISVS